MKQEVYFPDVAASSLDLSEEWLVKEIDLKEKKVLYEGRGKNEGLELLYSYLHYPQMLDYLTEGEFVLLPKEYFLSDESVEEALDQIELF